MGVFEDIQQKSISEPQGKQAVSGFVPTKAVSSGDAEFLSGIAKVGKGLYDKSKKDALQIELEQGRKDFIAKEEAEGFAGAVEQTAMLEEQTADFFNNKEETPVQEAMLLTDMRTRIKKWDQAFNSKRISAAEFKIKMESTLRKYISMNPGLASEFRKIASGTLGFDPTGAEVNAIFAQQKAAAKTGNEIQKATVDLMKKFGMFDPKLDTVTNVQLHGANAVKMQQMQSQVDFQYNSLNKANLLNKNNQQRISNMEVGSDIVNGRTSINAILSSDASPVEKQQQLELLRSSASSKYRGRYPDLGASDLDSTLKPLNLLITQAQDVASNKLEREALDNTFNAQVGQALVNMSNTPQGARAMAIFRTVKGSLVPLPASVQVELEKWVRGDSERLKNSVYGSDGSVSPFSGTKDIRGDSKTVAQKWVKEVGENLVQNIDPKNRESVAQFENFVQGTMVPMFSDPDKVSAIEYDTILKVAGDKKFVDIVKAMPDSDRVKSKLARVSSAYSVALIQKFGHEAYDNYDPDQPKRFSLSEAVFGVDKERLIQIERDQEGLFFFSPKPGLIGSNKLSASQQRAFAEGVASEFNSKYASRLNDSIKISAHLKGHTNYKGMMDQYLERTPELVSFMKKDTQTNE